MRCWTISRVVNYLRHAYLYVPIMEKPFHLTKLWHHGNDSSVIQSGICVRIATLLRDTKSLSEPILTSFQWYYQIHVPTKSQYIHIPSWNSTEKCVSELANFAQAANVLMSARADDSSHHAPLSRKPTAFCNPILSAAMQAQSFGDTQGQSNISFRKLLTYYKHNRVKYSYLKTHSSH